MFKPKEAGRVNDGSELRLESADPYAESLRLDGSALLLLLSEASLARSIPPKLPEGLGGAASPPSLTCVCHRGGRGRCRADGVDAKGVCVVPVEELKVDVDRLKPSFPRFTSTCLRNASKSGFASMGSCFGIAAPNDLTDEVGELQFSRGSREESRGSADGSMVRPK